MSKKDLSRTIIEGGRNSFNKFERRYSNKKERTAVKKYLHQVKHDPDLFDYEVCQERVPVRREFDDKLGPVVRWLESRIGMSWDDVYSEIRTKFDVRTIAGRHVVVDHMLGYVVKPNQISRWGYEIRDRSLYIDDEGFLRAGKFYHFSWRAIYGNPYKTVISNKVVGNWIGNRKVIDYGAKCFWAEAQEVSYSKCTEYSCPFSHREVKEYIREYTNIHNRYCFRLNCMRKEHEDKATIMREHYVRMCLRKAYYFAQTNEFSPEDYGIWNHLTANQKEAITYKPNK